MANEIQHYFVILLSTFQMTFWSTKQHISDSKSIWKALWREILTVKVQNESKKKEYNINDESILHFFKVANCVYELANFHHKNICLLDKIIHLNLQEIFFLAHAQAGTLLPLLVFAPFIFRTNLVQIKSFISCCIILSSYYFPIY